jgi:hypothetical protein
MVIQADNYNVVVLVSSGGSSRWLLTIVSDATSTVTNVKGMIAQYIFLVVGTKLSVMTLL